VRVLQLRAKQESRSLKAGHCSLSFLPLKAVISSGKKSKSFISINAIDKTYIMAVCSSVKKLKSFIYMICIR
jgi:hypothetical protein